MVPLGGIVLNGAELRGGLTMRLAPFFVPVGDLIRRRGLLPFSPADLPPPPPPLPPPDLSLDLIWGLMARPRGLKTANRCRLRFRAAMSAVLGLACAA